MGGFGYRAADDASGLPEDLADRLEAGGQALVPHHFPAGRGVGTKEGGPTVQVRDLGIATSILRSRGTGGPCRPRAATALMLVPHTGNFVRCLPGLPARTVILHNL